MGVTRTTYLVFGWKLPADLKAPDGSKINVYEDELLPYVEGRKGIKESIIYDQMCGEYTVFGVILGVLYDDNDDFKSIDMNECSEPEMRMRFIEVFKFRPPNEPPQVLFFNHFS